MPYNIALKGYWAILSQKLSKTYADTIYDYDYRLNRTFVLIKKDLSKENQVLIEKYDRAMIFGGFD